MRLNISRPVGLSVENATLCMTSLIQSDRWAYNSSTLGLMFLTFKHRVLTKCETSSKKIVKQNKTKTKKDFENRGLTSKIRTFKKKNHYYIKLAFSLTVYMFESER